MSIMQNGRRSEGASMGKRVKDEDEDAMSIIDISSDSDSSPSDNEEDDAQMESSGDSDDEIDMQGGKAEDDDEEDEYEDNSMEEVKDEDLEAAVEQPAPRRSPSVAPPTRGNVLLDLLNDRTPEVPDQSRFNSLPRDLKYIILSYLDREPHSVYCLSMVSRSWYRALNQDSSTDVDWQRRCNAMGAKKRSPHCVTWRETFIRQIRKRCLSCLNISDAAFGHLLEGQPDWLTVCSNCQKLPGPWQTITQYEAQLRQPRKSLSHLPFRAVKNTEKLVPFKAGRRTTPKKYIQLYLASAVGDPYDGPGLHSSPGDMRHIERYITAELQAQGGRPEDIKALLQYAKDAGQNKIFRSFRLLNMITALGPRVTRSETLRDLVRGAISYLDKVKTFSEEIEIVKQNNPELFTQKKANNSISKLIKKESRSWGDAIILGNRTMDDFLQYRRYNKNRVPGKMRQSEARKEELRQRRKQRKLQQEARRLTKEARKNGTLLPAYDNSKSSEKKNKKKRKAEPDESEEKIEDGVTEDNRKKRKTRATAPIYTQSQARQGRQCACGQTFSSKCQHRRCGTCCPGPCEKHKLRRKVDVYAAKKEEPED